MVTVETWGPKRLTLDTGPVFWMVGVPFGQHARFTAADGTWTEWPADPWGRLIPLDEQEAQNVRLVRYDFDPS